MKKLLLIALVIVATIASAQWYRATAVKKDGTQVSTSNSAKVAPIAKPVEDSTVVWIPTVFTPNWDGLNDMFKPVVTNADSFHFEIFTREGQLLYTLKAGQSWKGSGSTSAYVWLAKWIDKKGIRHKESGLLIELH